MPTVIDEKSAKSLPSYFNHHLKTYSPPLQRPGRIKQSDPRAVGAKVRHAIEQVFSGLGGWEGMLAWAQDNPDLFYGSVVPKLLPRDLDGQGRSNIQVFVYGKAVPNPKQVALDVQAASASTAQAEPTDEKP